MATRKKSSKKSAPTAIDKARKAFDIKAFRSEIAKLKRKGLVSKTYDARKVKATKYLKAQIKKFADVLSGEAQAVTLKNKEARKAYKESGYKTKGTKVVVPIQPGEKVTVTHGRIVRMKSVPSGKWQFIQIPVPYHNLKQYLHDIAALDDSRLKNAGERYAFRFYGNNSHGLFMTIELLIEHFEIYESVRQAQMNGRGEQDDVYQNLEIVRLAPNAKWAKNEKSKRPRSERQRQNARLRYENMNAHQYDKYKKVQSEKMKKLRARETPSERDARLAKARAYKKSKGKT